MSATVSSSEATSISSSCPFSPVWSSTSGHRMRTCTTPQTNLLVSNVFAVSVFSPWCGACRPCCYETARYDTVACFPELCLEGLRWGEQVSKLILTLLTQAAGRCQQ